MSRLNRAGPILGSLCSSSRPLGLRAHLWTLSLHRTRHFSHSSRRAKLHDGPITRDPVTAKSRRRTPDALPPSLREQNEAAACRQAIDEGEHPDTHFRSILHGGTMSKAVAAVCLMEASQQGYTDTNLGGSALAWLWDKRGDLVYPDDNDLVYAMVDLLVREGQEEEVWRWMSSESLRPKYAPDFIRLEWRDTAFKGLLISKTRLTTNRSLDDTIRTFCRARTLFIPEGGATGWMFARLTRVKYFQANETDPSINGGRRWDYYWPNTSIELWEEALELLETRYAYRDSQAGEAMTSMYHLRTPNPEPLQRIFEDAVADPNHSLRKMKAHITRRSYRNCAYHASDELRRMGRYKDAATLDAAREEIFPQPREYGDRLDRESIFAQGITAKKLPFPKFK
jgi:hypothetical protein